MKKHKAHHKPNPFLVVIGVLLSLLGLVGLVVPILQGIFFLAAGLAILSIQLPWVKKRVDKLKTWIKNKKKAF